jgi:uncharacterized protein DUF6090
METGKTEKYLKYAISEIVLVVIGILIALQLNTWNTERLNRAQEQIYLKRLVIDLESDLVNLQFAIEGHQKRLILGKFIAEQLGDTFIDNMLEWDSYKGALEANEQNKNWFPESFGETFFQTVRFFAFDQTRVTFEELISSGKIDIVQDQGLRTMIQEHYPHVKEFEKFQNGIILTVQETYRSALIENNISSLNTNSLQEVKAKMVNAERLIVTLENFLVLSGSAISTMSHGEASIEARTQKLIDKIRAEIQ